MNDELKVDKDKLEALKLVTQLAENESDRGWKRYTVMLTANGALLAFLSASVRMENIFLVSILAAIGAVVSWTWLKINEASYFYEHRWHSDMEAIIESEPFLSLWIRGRNNPRISRPHKKSGLYLFSVLPKFITAFWVIIFFVAILNNLSLIEFDVL